MIYVYEESRFVLGGSHSTNVQRDEHRTGQLGEVGTVAILHHGGNYNLSENSRGVLEV